MNFCESKRQKFKVQTHQTWLLLHKGYTGQGHCPCTRGAGGWEIPPANNERVVPLDKNLVLVITTNRTHNTLHTWTFARAKDKSLKCKRTKLGFYISKAPQVKDTVLVLGGRRGDGKSHPTHTHPAKPQLVLTTNKITNRDRHRRRNRHRRSHRRNDRHRFRYCDQFRQQHWLSSAL